MIWQSMAGTKEIRLLQVNLRRSSAAQSLVFQTARDEDIDILLLTEPYKKTNQKNWFEDNTSRAAIVVCNQEMNLRKSESSDKGYVWAETNTARIYSCYYSPNDSKETFEAQLEALGESISQSSLKVLITGDFNAKSPLWQETRLDRRGQLVTELLARKDLVVVNQGDKPTFERGESFSIIDLTLADHELARKITGWEVWDKESLSDHNYIYFALLPHPKRSTQAKASNKPCSGWNVKKMDKGKLNTEIEALKVIQAIKARFQSLSENANKMAREGHLVLSTLCNAVMPKKKHQRENKRNPMYWWNEEIAEQRKKCLAARRKFTRSRGNQDLKQELREARNQLKRSIKKSKEKHWKELIQEVEDDPWGLPYKIVANKLRVHESIPQLNDKAWVTQIISDLFPRQDQVNHIIDVEEENRGNPDPFTKEELEEERKKLKLGKAPGPDGVPNEIIRTLLEEIPDLLLQIFNKCLEEGVFPNRWKKQKLVLLRKGDKPLDRTSSYRPICLLDSAGKVLEGLILHRINIHLQEHQNHSANQYGFKKNCSTVHAIEETVKVAKEAREKGGRKKGFCALIALDIKNAFNSLRWCDILISMAEREFPAYIRKLVASYLSNRIIRFEGKEWFIQEEMSCGAPQGSRLGPFFWNLVYDSFLEMKLTRGARIIGFADDAILIVEAGNEIQLELRMEENISRIKSWLESRELEMAVHKTEALLVTKRKKYRKPKLEIEGVAIEWKNQITYLGVEIDRNLSFGPHINKVALKASKTIGNLCRLMPNVGGSKEKKRKLIASVATSQMLYAAPAWREGASKTSYLKRLTAVHRLGALRIVSGYKTIPECSAMVLAGTPPIGLQIAERSEVHDEIKNGQRNFLEPQERKRLITRAKKEARSRLVERWQHTWDNESKGRWTYRLVPDIKTWIERTHGELGFHLTQAFTGHGAFRSYLSRIHRVNSEACPGCPNLVDNAEHTIFYCTKFIRERQDLEEEIGNRISAENVLNIMMESESNWSKVDGLIRKIMDTKAEELKS